MAVVADSGGQSVIDSAADAVLLIHRLSADQQGLSADAAAKDVFGIISHSRRLHNFITRPGTDRRGQDPQYRLATGSLRCDHSRRSHGFDYRPGVLVHA